jgi:hypothetical protein
VACVFAAAAAFGLVAGAAAQQADDDRSVSRQEFQSAMAVSTPAAHIAAACGRQ